MSSGQRAFAAVVKTLGILFTILLLTTIITPALAVPDIQMTDSSSSETYAFNVIVHNRGVLDVKPFKLTLKLKSGEVVLAEKSVAINVPAGETVSQKFGLTLTGEDIKRLQTNQSKIAFEADIGYQISVLGFPLMTIKISQNVNAQ